VRLRRNKPTCLTGRLTHRLTSVGWVVTVPLLAMALAWLVGLDRWVLPASLGITFFPLALAPVWLIVIGALAGRQWPLATTAALVAVVHLAAVGPALPTDPAPITGAGEPLRIVTANSSFRNTTPDEWASALLALDADVIVVQEYAPTTREALFRAGVRERYPRQSVSLRPYSAGVAMFSRLPMRGTSVPTFGQDGVAASVKVGDRWMRILNVHTVALPHRSAWRDSFTDLERYLVDQPAPLIAAGDFNATLWHQPMRELLQGPLRDAHADRHRGLATTWPVGKPGVPFALLDHVLVTSTIDVRSVAERTLPGSDHRAVVADLLVRYP
jgi:endonuclease/exonuclease/phosphatase (EEP) superfamily protein YafD